jgi:6-phosphogluconolactonase
MSNARCQVHQFRNDDELAQHVAQRLVQKFSAAPGTFHLALSGGRISKNLFSELGKAFQSSPKLRDQVEFWWADERAVGPKDPESNFFTAEELLFKPASIPKERVHRIQGELGRNAAADVAEQEVSQVSRAGAANRVAQFDLILLGMGEDGHVASLFPGQQLPKTAGRTYISVTGPKPPPERVSLTYEALKAAKDIWVLVAGAGKAGMLQSCLSEAGSETQTLPLAQVIASRVQTELFSSVI